MINPSHDHEFLPDARSRCSPCKTSAPCLDRFSSFLSREFLGHHFLPPIKSMFISIIVLDTQAYLEPAQWVIVSYSRSLENQWKSAEC